MEGVCYCVFNKRIAEEMDDSERSVEVCMPNDILTKWKKMN